MKTIILVQHTESEHHIKGHIGAWQDWNLTERGREQAFRIGEWLQGAGCDHTWSMFVSPQIRAWQTAEGSRRPLSIIGSAEDGSLQICRTEMKRCIRSKGSARRTGKR